MLVKYRKFNSKYPLTIKSHPKITCKCMASTNQPLTSDKKDIEAETYVYSVNLETQPIWLDF